MLVDEQNSNVLAFGGKAIKGGFNSRCFGLAVDNQEVLLAIWWLGNVLHPSYQSLILSRLGIKH